MKSFSKINKASEIHLLNLDVEGFEENILESFFSSKNFPWVVCVEDLGFLADELNRSNIDSLMKKNSLKSFPQILQHLDLTDEFQNYY